MEKPTIIINGKTYEMKEPKARAWRLITEFDENRGNLKYTEFIDKHAEMITYFFEGLSVDEILDNVNLSDITKIFLDCYRYMSDLIYSKVKRLDSTSDDGGEIETI